MKEFPVVVAVLRSYCQTRSTGASISISWRGAREKADRRLAATAAGEGGAGHSSVLSAEVAATLIRSSVRLQRPGLLSGSGWGIRRTVSIHRGIHQLRRPSASSARGRGGRG